MAFIRGGSAKVLVGGFDLTSFLNNASVSVDTALAEATVFGDVNRDYQRGGPLTASVTCSGFADVDSASGSEQVLARILDTESTTFDTTWGYMPITIAYKGNTDGNNCFVGTVLSGSYEIAPEVTSLMPIAATFVVGESRKVAAAVPTTGEEGGFGVRGVLLAAQANVPTVSGIFGTEHNNGGSSANGAIFNLHLTTAATSASIRVEHSTMSGSGFTTLCTFSTTAAAVRGQSVFVSGTINQYVRAYVVSASGTNVAAVSYVRL